MILFALGLLDLAAGIVLLLAKFSLFFKLGIFLGIFLIVKGLIFIKSISSIIDIISGIVLLLLVYGYGVPFYWLFSLWLIQKGFFSFFS